MKFYELDSGSARKSFALRKGKEVAHCDQKGKGKGLCEGYASLVMRSNGPLVGQKRKLMHYGLENTRPAKKLHREDVIWIPLEKRTDEVLTTPSEVESQPLAS